MVPDHLAMTIVFHWSPTRHCEKTLAKPMNSPGRQG
jgi:hypothetical protein